MRKILITSALPYANGPLHFGHIAGAYLPADCYARYERLKGSNVLYICGSDEYGIAITLSAELAGRTPQEHVDLFHEVNQQLFARLNFSFDHFSRTTWPGHRETVQQFFKDLCDKGYIEEKVTEQLYSEGDQKFLADRYVVGECPRCGFAEARGDECQRCGASYEATDLLSPRSKLSGSPLGRRCTKHWFLRFDLFKEDLAEWIACKPWKANVLNFAKSYIDDLKPRAITRDMEWGIPVPGAEGKVFYVWFDAPIGYISATKDWAQKKGQPDAWRDYWLDPQTQYVQFIGKDNIPFHAVFFPAMEMGQNVPYKIVDALPANEFYMLEGRQFSKSDGWTIDLERFFQQFTADQIRYTIAANAPETQDAEFTWKDFQTRCNSELIGKWGNLVNRTLVFAKNHCEGKIPPLQQLSSVDLTFLEQIQVLHREADLAYSTFRLRKASQVMMELAQLGNVYFDVKKPWIAARNAQTHTDMAHTIACCIQCIKTLSLISYPIIPSAAEATWKMLGFPYPLTAASFDMEGPLESGQTLGSIEILFARVEEETIQGEIDRLRASSGAKATHIPVKTSIGIEEVRQLDIRVGQILDVQRVPQSKKMLKLLVDVGTDKRTILSGIGEKWTDLTPLIGKKIPVVVNLKPAVLMGHESQGLLLSTDAELPYLQDAPVGACIS